MQERKEKKNKESKSKKKKKNEREGRKGRMGSDAAKKKLNPYDLKYRLSSSNIFNSNYA